ncbi:MAG: DUF2088 domain-containing protein [Pirellulales bacterium]|nr:DUF2088 domain-containing protein [Pirellulales bacterium]
MPNYPSMFRLRQHFDTACVEDVSGEVEAQLARLGLGRTISPGQSVAVAVGSRGIAELPGLVTATVEHLRRLDARPFLVPAMGSHGGGTAQGQQRVLESYGLTESAVGCPIRASMDTVILGNASQGFPIHFDRLAAEADHVLLCNRVKPHTLFAGAFQSGLMKMLLVGLGKAEGAHTIHQAVECHSFDEIVRGVGEQTLRDARVVVGLAVVENAYDRPALIEAVPAAQILSREPELLRLAQEKMARLPFQHVDLLVIDRIGKDVSGSGMDTNIVGRKVHDHEAAEDEFPKVKRIAIRRLTPASHGNALGIGIAEFCRSEILRSMDVAATRLNVLTSGHVTAAMLPLDYPTDRAMLNAALGTIGLVAPTDARVLHIADTLHLTELECSAAYLPELPKRPDLEILTPPCPMNFDTQGGLVDVVF